MRKLVVLGAGIGGLSVIHELKQRRCLDNGELDVTLIDKDFTHFIGFTLPWIMRGWRTAQQASIAPSRQFLSGVKTITGTVAAVDSQRRTVTGDNFEISYDALVVALGAKKQPQRNPRPKRSECRRAMPPLLQRRGCG